MIYKNLSSLKRKIYDAVMQYQLILMSVCLWDLSLVYYDRPYQINGVNQYGMSAEYPKVLVAQMYCCLQLGMYLQVLGM